MTNVQIISKVPGELQKIPPEKYLEDLSKLSKARLLEVKDREEQILKKKSQISKLPDKGARIKAFYEKVLKEIERQDGIEQAAEMFSELNIASTGHKQLTNLEWTGKYDKNLPNDNQVIDSDDDEDPIQILAQSMDLKMKVKILPPEPTLITDADLEEIKSFSKDSSSSGHSSLNISSGSDFLELYAKHIIERKEYDGMPAIERFKPFKTTKTNIHNPEKEMKRVQNKDWEATAATPPLIKHPGVKMLSLENSVEIQMKYLESIKALQKQQAEERLAKRMIRLEKMKLPEEHLRKVSKLFTTYRTRDSLQDQFHLEGSQDNHEEEGVFDEDDVKDMGGLVTFTVHD